MPRVELDLECRQVLQEMHVPLDAIQLAGDAAAPGEEIVVKLWVPALSRPLSVPVQPADRSWRSNPREYLRHRIRAALRGALGTLPPD